MEEMYQRALEKMVPAYRRWSKAGDKYDEIRRRHPESKSLIERAFVREERAYDILSAQTRLIGELFDKAEDTVWADVENMYFRNGGE